MFPGIYRTILEGIQTPSEYYLLDMPSALSQATSLKNQAKNKKINSVPI
ncbi:MAG: hypothetical protein ACJAWL_000853 [Motiliproteus sp.]|jgi:hypothetical protein